MQIKTLAVVAACFCATISAANVHAVHGGSVKRSPQTGNGDDPLALKERDAKEFALRDIAEFKPDALKRDEAEFKPDALKRDEAEFKPDALKRDEAEFKPDALKRDEAEFKPDALKRDVAEFKPDALKARDAKKFTLRDDAEFKPDAL